VSEDEEEEEDSGDKPGEDGEESGSEEVDIHDEAGDTLDDETLKKFASDDDDDEQEQAAESDSDSDGYGPGGLSFDQVLAEMKGEVREKASGVGKSTSKPKRKREKTVSFIEKKTDSGKRDRSKGARRPAPTKRSKMLDI